MKPEEFLDHYKIGEREPLASRAIRIRRNAMEITLIPGYWVIKVMGMAYPSKQDERPRVYTQKAKAADGQRSARVLCSKYRVPRMNITVVDQTGENIIDPPPPPPIPKDSEQGTILVTSVKADKTVAKKKKEENKDARGTPQDKGSSEG